MFLKLLVAFIVIPLVEFVLLMQLATATSIWTTIGIVVLTGMLGSWLARREGVMAWTRFQEALAQNRMPSREIQDGLMIVFAAALLLTPGLLTDAFGFTLLIPPGREFIRKHILSRFFKGFKVQVVGGGAANQHGAGPSAAPLDSNTVDAKSVQPKQPQ